MSFAQMLMACLASRPAVTISNLTAQAVTTNPVNPVARYRLTSDGDIVRTAGSNSTTDSGDWLAPKVGMSGFECRMTVTSGSLSSGTTGSWLNLGTTREWTLTRTSDGTTTATATLDIGYAGTSTALKSVTISFDAERSSP